MGTWTRTRDSEKASTVNTISYKGKALLEGPQNFFRCRVGIGPSFGIFRATEEVVSHFFSSGINAGDLVFADELCTVTLKEIWFVRATPVSMEVREPGEAVSGKTNIYDVILADERILWSRLQLEQDYNTYPEHRITEVVDETRDYVLENLNVDVEYTWTQIVADIETALGITIDETDITWPTDWAPRNVIGKGIAAAEVLQRLLEETSLYLAVDIRATGADRYTLHTLGDSDVAELAEITTTVAAGGVQGGETKLNPYVRQGATFKVAFGEMYAGSRVSLETGEAGMVGLGTDVTRNPYASIHTAGGYVNEADLQAIAADLGDRYNASFTNTWFDYLLAGIHLYVTSKTIHEVTWQSTARGAFTRIRAFRPYDVTQMDQKHTLFAYGKYLLPKAELFIARITVNSTYTNYRYSYSFVEVEKAEAGYAGWSIVTVAKGGRAGTAYNLVEQMNSAAGEQGNGVDRANLVDPGVYTFTIKAAPVNVLVMMMEIPCKVAGVWTTEYWFQYENGVDGTCDE